MAFDPLDYAREHPATAIGVGLVVLVGAYLIFAGGGQSAQPANPMASAYAAEIQAADQQAQLQAQMQGQAAQINGQIALATQQDNAAVAIATLQQQTQQNQDNLTYKLGAYQSDAAVKEAQIGAGVSNNQINTAGAVQLAGIAAQQNVENTIVNGQVQIAGITGQTQQQISTNQSNVAIQQANDQAAVGEAYAKAAQISAQGSMFGSILGGIGGIAKAFL